MGRKRLLTILVGVVAAMGLTVGPAAALDLSLDLGVTGVDAKLDRDGVDVSVGDEDRKVGAKVNKDGVEVELGDEKVSTKEVTDTVKDAAKETTDRVKDATSGGGSGGSGGGGDDGSGGGGSGGGSGDSGSGGGGDDGSGGGGSGGGSSDADDDVTTAGGAESVERPEAMDPEQARQLLAGAGGPSGPSGPGGDVTPSFDLAGGGGMDLDDPIIAAPSAPGGASVDGGDVEWETAAPETADRRSDAELAAVPGAPSPDEVPAGLKLIAGLLVAGTGTVWHLTRRELQPR